VHQRNTLKLLINSIPKETIYPPPEKYNSTF
jgi:hypothetical protein